MSKPATIGRGTRNVTYSFTKTCYAGAIKAGSTPPPDQAAPSAAQQRGTTLAEHDRTKARGKLPISRHPLFPATVALWFGALFGLGSLAIRPSALDSLA